jgi:hypothetical protein
MKKVETKILEFKCYRCSGKGLIENPNQGQHALKNGETLLPYLDCSVCEGTGIYKETYYYFIDGKKKIAFSSDTLA